MAPDLTALRLPLLAATAGLLLLGGAGAVARSGHREVIDMTGARVEVPTRIRRVACLEVLCYQRLFMLGAADTIVEMTRTAAPWMSITNPMVDAIPKVEALPNFEELAARDVDVAFFLYDLATTRKKLAALGIPGLVSQPAGETFTSPEGFAEANRRAIRIFGKVMGGEAERRAEAWCAYQDEKIRLIGARVARISPAKRVRLYYLRGPDALSTQGRGSATYWYGVMAGADMVVKDLPLAGKGEISIESILRWDPEVILVGRQYEPDLVLRDPRWQAVTAVRRRRVVPSPAGVFYWDGGPESVLLVEFLAKELYPDLFPDLDLVREVQDYYARFYGYVLSKAQAGLILEGRSPDGNRLNWARN
jgi:iron complex transport system substrate-binding protein